MIAECVAVACIIGLARPEPPPTLAQVVDAPVVIDRGTWNDSGDTGIPGWFDSEGDRRIHLRPETARAIRGRCGRAARTLATFILLHEAGHAHGIGTRYDPREHEANAYAYTRLNRTAKRLGFKPGPMPTYGSLLSTWRTLRRTCL
jgi:hypothetical protein